MRRRRRRAKSSCGGQTGVAAIEFAFVAPVLILLFVGMIDIVHYLGTMRRLNYAAFLVADAVTRNGPTITPADIKDYFAGAALALKPLSMADSSASDVRISVFDFRSGSAPFVWRSDSRSGTDCTDATQPTTLTAANDLVVVVICVQYTPPRASILNYTNILGFATKRIQQQVTMRPRQTTTLTCNPAGVTC